MINIFFITGTSGAGKTTSVDTMQTLLSNNLFAMYDFDEKGVPENPDILWRIDTTRYWLEKSIANSKSNTITIVCGVSVPSEIITLINDHNYPIIPHFGFIKIKDTIIEQRLQNRGWSKQLIHDNINWAHYLEDQVMKQKNHYSLDASTLSPDDSAQHFIMWIHQALLNKTDIW